MHELKILFQGFCVNNDGRREILVEETTNNLHVQIGFGEEGMYCKNIRMGELNPQVFDYLPKSLKDFLEEKHIKIRLFLPHSEQVMNRSHLIGEKGFLTTAQALIFKAATKAYVKGWVQDFSPSPIEANSCFNIFSADYWNNFRQFRQGMEGNLKPIFDFITNKTNLLFSQENQEISLINKMNDMQITLSNQAQFASLISFLPLKENISFRTLRNNLMIYLVNENILDQNGNYQINWIENHTLEEMGQTIAENFHKFCKKTKQNLDDYNEIIQNFQFSILNYLIAMKKQQLTLINQPELSRSNPAIKTLAIFLKKVAYHVWNQTVDIQFYSNADGANAYVKRGSNMIYVNLQGEHIHPFLNFYSIYQKNIHTSFDPKNFESITDWMNTLAHEITHIQENVNCQTTHDAPFRNKIAIHLLALFIHKERIDFPLIEIFKSSVNEKEEIITSKRQKIEKKL